MKKNKDWDYEIDKRYQKSKVIKKYSFVLGLLIFLGIFIGIIVQATK